MPITEPLYSGEFVVYIPNDSWNVGFVYQSQFMKGSCIVGVHPKIISPRLEDTPLAVLRELFFKNVICINDNRLCILISDESYHAKQFFFPSTLWTDFSRCQLFLTYQGMFQVYKIIKEFSEKYSALEKCDKP